MSHFAQPGEKQTTASALIVSTEAVPRVLLVHHKKFNTWIQPGGHVDFGENPFEGAIREALEETGIDISPYLQAGKKLDVYAYLLPEVQWIMEQKIAPNGGQPEHFHVDHIYLVRIPWQEPQHQEEEAHGIGWFTQHETEGLTLFDNTKFIVNEALNELE